MQQQRPSTAKNQSNKTNFKKHTVRYRLTCVRTAITKEHKITSSGKDVEKRVCCWWEYKLVQPLKKKLRRFLRKPKTEVPYDLAIPFLGGYLKKMRMLIRKDACTPMFTTVIFTVAKTWKQPRCPPTDEWIKNMWYMHNGVLLSHRKRRKCCHLQQHG